MPYTGIVKYHVKLSFEVDGLVERADIIGAIFGQTEGLLGPDMNLNELQRVSKVGRIEVNTFNTENTTKGDALLPMSTDIDTCSLIAAAIESIDKVGPFDSVFKLDAIDDVRASKKEDIVKRAKRLSKNGLLIQLVKVMRCSKLFMKIILTRLLHMDQKNYIAVLVYLTHHG